VLLSQARPAGGDRRLVGSPRARRGLPAARAAGLALLAAACTPSDAAEPRAPAAAAEWTAPEAIPAGTDAPLSPGARLEDVAAEPGGRVHAIFSDSRAPERGWSRVMYARRDGRGWTAPLPLDDRPGRSGAPRVVVDAAGRVHVLWWKGLDPGLPDRATHLLHRVRGPAGWSRADTLYHERDPHGVGDLQLAVVADGSGRLHVVHARAEGGHGYLVLQGGRRRPGPAPGLAGGDLRWNRTAARAGRPELAYVTARVSEEVRSANNDLWVRSPAGSGWTEAVPVFRAPSRTHDPALLTDARGVRHAVWVESAARGRSERLLHATSRDGVRWSRPADVAPPSPEADFYAPRLGLDGRGRLVLVFLRADAHAVVPQYTRLDAAGWGAPLPLGPQSTASTLELALADDGRGTLHALWRGMDGRYRASRLPDEGPGR
jgi:hypothetical protein